MQINTHYPWVCDPEPIGAPCVSTRVGPLGNYVTKSNTEYMYIQKGKDKTNSIHHSYTNIISCKKDLHIQQSSVK